MLSSCHKSGDKNPIGKNAADYGVIQAFGIILVLSLFGRAYARDDFPVYEKVIYRAGRFTLEGYLCEPSGYGPFPGAVNIYCRNTADQFRGRW